MVTYNTVLEDRQYREVSKRAAKYYLESAKMVDLPLKQTDIPNVKQYRWTRLTEPRIAAEDEVANVATGGQIAEEWDEEGDLGDVQHGFNDYTLGSIQMTLKVMNSNINTFVGSNLLADKREALIKKFALDVDTGLIKGIYDRTGKVLIASGYQTQATSVANLNGTDSNLITKGDIWEAINKMIDTIPFAMREEGPPMIMLWSENIAKTVQGPKRIYQDKIEWDFIKSELMGENAQEARKIGSVRVTNKLLVSGTDTKGTHDRIALYVPDGRFIGKAVSRSFSLLGEKQGLISLKQAWGWTGRCIIDNALAGMFSEQIVWV